MHFVKLPLQNEFKVATNNYLCNYYLFLRLRATQLLKNHALIEDADLAYEVLLAKLRDHCYGQIAESIKQSIGRFSTIFPNLPIVFKHQIQLKTRKIMPLRSISYAKQRDSQCSIHSYPGRLGLRLFIVLVILNLKLSLFCMFHFMTQQV